MKQDYEEQITNKPYTIYLHVSYIVLIDLHVTRAHTLCSKQSFANKSK